MNMEMNDLGKMTLRGELSPAKVKELLAAAKAAKLKKEAAAITPVSTTSSVDPTAAPAEPTLDIASVEPVTDPATTTTAEPVVPTPIEAPVTPETPLKNTVEFTNQQLLDFLKGRTGMLMTSADLSQHFKITPELAAEIINDLKYEGGEQCIGIDNKVLPQANIEKIEAALRTENILGEKFIHIPLPQVVDINLDQPAPDIDLNRLEAEAAKTPDPAATPSLDPVAAPAEPPKVEKTPAAPMSLLSKMTKHIFDSRSKRLIIATTLVVGMGGYGTLTSNKSPDQAPAPTAQVPKPGPATTSPKAPEAKQSEATPAASAEQKKEVTDNELYKAAFPEKLHDRVKTILATPDAKAFIAPFLQKAKMLQSDQLADIPESVRTQIFENLNKNTDRLNIAWNGTDLTLKECLVNVENKTCNLRENLSEIAKIYREILQETSGFPRTHDAQLPSKTIVDMHAYVREEIQKYLTSKTTKQ